MLKMSGDGIKKEKKTNKKTSLKFNCRYCFPLLHQAHHPLLVKLNWSGIICTSQNHVDYYPVPCALLDGCILIV